MSKKPVTEGQSNPFALSGTSPPSARSLHRIHLAGTRIIALLAEEGTPKTEAKIHQTVIGRKQDKVLALRELLAAKKLTRIGSGKRGDPFKYSILNFPPLNSQAVIEEFLV